ncbi:cyclic dehypoxanthinyl futalosine synthase [Anaeromyxobacter sp. Fw109-5]|uniref:cyclic dehypoxanthinyl futalosine synthase n=1 Tax=Anaeromyxobacter sp. (strain Fw109-5) TaxID=404589 RepID=UPI0000ED6E70|nr:cyclic dehypoxanthinyl futalosine synthase [Anaeromyxobacter sp. Fw109-5]ABS28385.1 Radical SAM domain protein [Anaeromyxobacter sp. Fw109-5]
MPKLRAAAVSFLNAHPLTVGLEGSDRIELVPAEPSRCAAMLEDGEVDLALVSVAALTKGEYEIVPGIAIGADGPVQTVVLAGEQSPAIWDEVFLDTASRTSHVLAKLVLDAMGVHPKFTPMHADEGLARAKGTKGALVIGDRAFGVRANHVLDLGREWTHLTGLPMIFALWAARPGRVSPEDVQELTRAAQHGLGVRTELAQRFAAQKGGDPERFRRYLTQRIRYGLGPHELDGLEAFLGRAAEKGFLPPMKLRFVDDVVRTTRTRRLVSLDTALQKGADGERLDADEAELLDEKAPLLELGLAADARRRALHPDGAVTYIVSRNVNYTNVCTTACHFCAFYRPRGHKEAYVLDRDELTRKIDETVALGGIEILLQGGLHPDLGVEWYEDLFRWVKARWPAINLHALSPEEIWHIARTSELPLDDTIARLIAAGLDSIPGGGAEILDDEVRRRIAPLKCSSDEWLSVMRAAHLKGLRSTATMMFGVGEEPRHRVAHLVRLRELQDETRGFTAFICWPFQSANTRLTASDTSAQAYLRVNAVSRLVLDNVPNLQASWVTMGGGVAQASLHMGCNDFGSVMIEENVVSAAGTTFQMDAEEVERHIRDAGFRPARRNMRYERVGDAAA